MSRAAINVLAKELARIRDDEHLTRRQKHRDTHLLVLHTLKQDDALADVLQVMSDIHYLLVDRVDKENLGPKPGTPPIETKDRTLRILLLACLDYLMARGESAPDAREFVADASTSRGYPVTGRQVESWDASWFQKQEAHNRKARKEWAESIYRVEQKHLDIGLPFDPRKIAALSLNDTFKDFLLTP